MRYYSIVIYNDADNASVYHPQSLDGAFPDASWTSYVNGQTLGGAMNVQLDVPLSDFATPTGEAWVRIQGPSIQEISQSNDLRGKNILVYAGMQRGLPLATRAAPQSGLIFQGFINKSFGNWVGTNQTLDLIVVAGSSPDGVGSQAKPKNLWHGWKKGSPLGDAIRTTLTTAFPGYEVDVSVSPKLVLTEDDAGYYGTATQYAKHIRDASKDIVGGDYSGVRIVLKQKKFVVFDGTSPTTPTQIDFKDLVGQPTWIDPLTVQVKTIMRADINVGDYVTLPKTQATTTSEGALPAGTTARSNSIFQGTFQVGQVRHVGNFRQPDGDSWASVFNVFSTTASA